MTCEELLNVNIIVNLFVRSHSCFFLISVMHQLIVHVVILRRYSSAFLPYACAVDFKIKSLNVYFAKRLWFFMLLYLGSMKVIISAYLHSITSESSLTKGEKI